MLFTSNGVEFEEKLNVPYGKDFESTVEVFDSNMITSSVGSLIHHLPTSNIIKKKKPDSHFSVELIPSILWIR